MSEEQNDEPKIIVDSDWKEEARKEKEKAEQIAEEAGPSEIPAASFGEILQMILLQASVSLGGYQDPQTGQKMPPNLMLAKHYIDLMEVLRNKTKGNLDQNEQQALDGTLHELRMAFVQVSSARGQASAPPQTPEG
jgi:hypothetical protein